MVIFGPNKTQKAKSIIQVINQTIFSNLDQWKTEKLMSGLHELVIKNLKSIKIHRKKNNQVVTRAIIIVTDFTFLSSRGGGDR